MAEQNKSDKDNLKYQKSSLANNEKILKTLKYAAEAYGEISGDLSDILQKSAALNIKNLKQIETAKQLSNIQKNLNIDVKKRMLSESLVAAATKLQSTQTKQQYDVLKKQVLANSGIKKFNEELIELYAVRAQFESDYNEELKSYESSYKKIIDANKTMGSIIKSRLQNLSEDSSLQDVLDTQRDIQSVLLKRSKFLLDSGKMERGIYDTLVSEIKQLDVQKIQRLQMYATQKELTGEMIKNSEQEIRATELAELRSSAERDILNALGDQGEKLGHMGKLLKGALTSPLALLGGLLALALKSFSDIGERSRAFLDATKLTVNQTDKLRTLAHDLSVEYRDQGVSMEKALDAETGLIGVYGTVNRLSDDLVKNTALLEKAFGIAGVNAAGVTYQIQKSTGLSAESASNIAALGANFAQAAGVAPDLVFQDIAQSADAIATYFKGTPADLMRMGVEARRLGLSIQRVADVSKALLTFESSIEDQMTASVLLGKEINLDKARELALSGDILGATQETLRQIGSLSQFNKMNAVQKEAIAKAAGMTVGELQQSLEKSEALKNMTAKQRAEYEEGLSTLKKQNKMTADKILMDQKNQLTQEKIKDAIEKIEHIFANVLLPILEPIFDLFADILSVVGWILTPVTLIAKGLHSIAPVLKAIVASVLIWKVAVWAIGGGLKAAGASLLNFKGISTAISGVWSGITKFIGAIPAQIAKMTTATKAAAAVTRGTSPVGFAAGLGSTAAGSATGAGSISTLAKTGSMATSLLKGAAALLVIAGAVFVAGKAFQQFSNINWAGVGMGLIVLTSFSLLASALSFIAAEIIIGSIAIAALGVSLIPFAYALNLAAPAVASLSSSLSDLIKNTEVSKLFSIAFGLAAIGASLATIATFGTMAIPALAVISSISNSNSPSSEPVKSADTGHKEDFSDIIKKLDELKDALTRSIPDKFDIELDAAKFGELIAKKQSRNFTT